MIKLNLTADEFIFILDTLSENIEVQPISNEEFDAKVAILRHYGHDEFIYLLNGLRNGDLSSDWLPVVQYVYNNGEIQFLEVETPNQEYAKHQIQEFLNLFEDTTKHFPWILIGLLPLALVTFGWSFFVFYGFTWWWKAPLYTCGSLLFYLIVMNVASTIFVTTTARSFRFSFLELIVKHRLSYHKSITILKDAILRKLACKPNQAREELYKSLLIKTEAEIPTLLFNRRDIENQVQTIFTVYRATINRFVITAIGLHLVALIVFISSFWIFYDLTWWKAGGYTVGAFILFWIFMNLASHIVLKMAIRAAHHSFLDSFAIGYSSYDRALIVLERLKNFSDDRLSPKFGEWLYQSLDLRTKLFQEAEITNLVQNILRNFDALLTIYSLIHAVLALLGFVSMPIILYLSVFSEWVWWKALLSAITLSVVLIIILMRMIGYVAFKTITRLVYNAVLKLFSKDQASYSKAITVLETLRQSENKMGRYRVEERLYNTLEKGTADSLKKFAVFLRNHLTVILSGAVSITVIGGLVWLTQPGWWMIIIYVLSLPLLVFIFLGMLGLLARVNDTLAIQILHEEQASGRNKLWKSEAFHSEMLYATFWHHSDKANSLWKEQRWPKAKSTFEIVVILLQTLIDKQIRSPQPRPTWITQLMPKLSETLVPELAETLMYLGMCCHLIGELSKAQEVLENSLKHFAEDQDSKLTENRARIYAHLGICLFQLGSLSQALVQLEKSLENYQSLRTTEGYSKWHREWVGVKMWIALTHYFLGELPELERLKGELENHFKNSSMNMNEGGSGHSELRELVVVAKGYLARNFLLLGSLTTIQKHLQKNVAESELSFEEATMDEGSMEKYMKQHLNELPPDLQFLFRGPNEELKSSLAEYRNFIELDHIVENVDGRTLPVAERPLLTMYFVTFEMSIGKFSEARKKLEGLIKEYLSLIKEGHLELRLELSMILFALIACLFEEDERQHLRALENLFRQAFEHIFIANLEGQLSQVHIKMMEIIANWFISSKRPVGRDAKMAFHLSSLGLDWLESVFSHVSNRAKSALTGKELEIYQLNTDLALVLGRPEQAYITLERSKTRALAEQMLREQVVPSSANVPMELRDKYQKLRGEVNSLE